jgi:hypothetical protein
MRGDRRALVAGLVVLCAVLVTGCTRDAPTTPTAELPTAAATDPTPTEATEPADPYAIPADPDDIDEAYVEGVLEALSESVAAAARIIATSGEVTAETRAELAATHRAGPALDGVVRSFKRSIRNRNAHDVFNPGAQGVTIEVRRLLTRTPTCVFARVLRDTSDLVGQELDPLVGYFHIEPKRSDEDPERRNATPWMIVAEVGPPPRGQEYDDPCT